MSSEKMDLEQIRQTLWSDSKHFSKKNNMAMGLGIGFGRHRCEKGVQLKLVVRKFGINYLCVPVKSSCHLDGRIKNILSGDVKVDAKIISIANRERRNNGYSNNQFSGRSARRH